NAAVEGGLDLFRPIAQDTVDFLSFDSHQKAHSTNQLFDASISGDLDIQLENGPVQFALALEQVKESYSVQPDAIILKGDGFDGSSEGRGERNHLGIGAELNFPFIENFDLNVALRWDDYDDDSDVNSASSPRLALVYKPSENFLTRFSWGKSFRAPDMQRLFGGETNGFNDIIDPEFDGQVVQSVQISTVSNIELKEERGTNINLGFVWQATDDLDISMDLFNISLDDVVAAPSAQFVVNACSEIGLLCDQVIRDSQGTLRGNNSYVVIGPLNFAKQETQGIDLTLNQSWKNEYGEWEAKFMTTWISSFYFQAVSGIEKVENINLGVFPEFRSNLILNWQKKSLGATVRVTHIDEIAGSFCVECSRSQYISSWLSLNANFRYHFSEYSRVSFGINNIVNQDPHQDPTQNNWPWYSNSSSYYSATGREFYLQLDTSF
ncbi:MAG: TonB-dependent receptor, partial [Kangiellaceae bacterium]|nr:TonB-dependent receptor [Kangiellaceae bacterium]